MGHEVENMMYVTGAERFVPWHGLGVAVNDCVNSEEALKIAGLDWDVIPQPIYTEARYKIPGYIANTRSSDNSVLGIVSDKYKIVQNKEAFAFTDALLDMEAKYVTAGSLRGGKNIWLLANLPSHKILGDEVAQYLCFTNTHDGSGAVKVCMSPVRVVCSNTLNLALSKAKRIWTCRHMGKLEDKLHEATRTLELSNKYMEELNVAAERLANTSLTNDQLMAIVAEMFPINEDGSHRQLANMEKAKKEFMIAYYMPDIAQFRNTAWGMINAISDWCGHSSPQRTSATYQERNFERIINGHPMLDEIVKKCGVQI